MGLPVDELRNRHVSLEILWGRVGADLRERLLDTSSVEGRLDVLEDMLLEHVKDPMSLDPAVTYALEAFSTMPLRPVTAVTEQLGLSPRRFIDLFTTAVGLTPKRFCRIRRFQYVVQCLQAHRHVDLADVALACGYYDQSHFNHDFRTFAGVTPTTYLAVHGPSPNHVPLLG